MSTLEPGGPQPPGWILWPFRIAALVVMLPLRMLWEALTAAGWFLQRWLLEPLARAFRRLVWTPLAWIAYTLVWKPLAWAARRLVAAPLIWLARYLVVVPVAWLVAVLTPWVRRGGHGVMRWVLRPIAVGLVALWRRVLLPGWSATGHALRWLAEAAVRWILRPPARAVAWIARQVLRWVLRPIGLAIALVWREVLGPAWYAAGRILAWIGRLLYRWIVRPPARAIGWAARQAGRAVAWSWRVAVVAPWRDVVVPTGRWVRALTRPTTPPRG